jgi:phosphoglycolate phosphatase-like HAD superfamily hydrolase
MALGRRVLLFDIDGTLVTAGGAGRRALERAASAVYGPAAIEALGQLRFDGMTDMLILRETCGRLGRSFEAAECTRIFATYVDVLAEELPRGRYLVHDGVPDLLVALPRAGALLGLGTGNVRGGAMAKLAHGGLHHHFDFGGFGEDGESREEILRAALGRAAQIAGAPVSPADAIVIGDTPRDVEAARAIGCGAIGVATGRFDRASLLAAGAHRVFATLADPGAMEVLAGSVRLSDP